MLLQVIILELLHMENNNIAELFILSSTANKIRENSSPKNGGMRKGGNVCMAGIIVVKYSNKQLTTIIKSL